MNMKKFFSGVLSSFVGAWIAIVLFGVVAVLVIIALVGGLAAGSVNDGPSLEKHTLLVLNLDGEITEIDSDEVPDVMTLAQGNLPKTLSLKTIVDALDNAAENDNIDALYINCDGVSASPATLNAIRQAVLRFKDSGKKIYAYADAMYQGDYFIACAADSVFVNPYGNFTLIGIGGYTPFYKTLLDKIGVEYQVVKVGTYKSAVEPYILTSMSEPARAQLDTLYGSIWNCVKQEISQSRRIGTPIIDSLINKEFISTKSMKFVLSTKLIDGLCYRHEFEEKLAKYFDEEKYSDVNSLTITEFSELNVPEFSKSSNEIAVLYACGGIDDGESEGIQSEKLVPQILELADDKNVKGLVLRVNSPGGSAFGSEQIWEALEVFKKTGKPFIVSMGDYAASGGYYISCGADHIYADQLTITGSIGIFGLIPNIKGLFEDKLGINMELVATNPEGVISIYEPMTPTQAAAMQKMVEDGYDLFTKRCADGRGMSQDEIKRMGEGRVWDAGTALRIGLVDEIGSLQDAIALAAKKSDLEDYSVVIYPEADDSFWKYMKMLESDMSALLQGKLIPQSANELLIEQGRRILSRQPVQARMQDMIIIL